MTSALFWRASLVRASFGGSFRLLLLPVLLFLCLECLHKFLVESVGTPLVLLVVSHACLLASLLLLLHDLILRGAHFACVCAHRPPLGGPRVKLLHQFFVFERVHPAGRLFRRLQLWSKHRLHLVAVDDARNISILHQRPRQPETLLHRAATLLVAVHVIEVLEGTLGPNDETAKDSAWCQLQ